MHEDLEKDIQLLTNFQETSQVKRNSVLFLETSEINCKNPNTSSYVLSNV